MCVIYDGIKRACVPSINKVTLLKTKTTQAITDRSKQMERWAKYNQELYAHENVITNTAISSLQVLPFMAELYDAIAGGKGQGKDGIPPEVIKAGNTTLFPHLHEFSASAGRECQYSLTCKMQTS